MVSLDLEDPAGLVQAILDYEWNPANTGGVTPKIQLAQRDIGPYGGLSSPNGHIWLWNGDQERDKTADIQRNYDDVRHPFTCEIIAKTYDKAAQLVKEVRRIQTNNLARPGNNLPTPDTTFSEWEELGAPVGWPDVGEYRLIINYEMIIYCQQRR